MSQSPVAETVRRAIEANPRSQKSLACAAGFPQPNMLSMIKTGATRVPLERIPALADALGLDRVDLLTACLREYQPGLLGVLDEVYGLERHPLETLRNHSDPLYLAAFSNLPR